MTASSDEKQSGRRTEWLTIFKKFLGAVLLIIGGITIFASINMISTFGVNSYFGQGAVLYIFLGILFVAVGIVLLKKKKASSSEDNED